MSAFSTLSKLAAGAGLVGGLAAAVLAGKTRRITKMAEEAVPPPGRFVDAGGNRFHVVEQGEGPPILFIHGLGAHLFHFTHPLFDRLAGFRLVAFDRAGSGYSTRANGATGGLAEQARQIAGLMSVLGLERPLVVGHSLGGAITLKLALDHPDGVAGLALLSPLTQPMDELPPELRGLDIRSALLRRIVAHTIAAPLGMRQGPWVLDAVFGPQKPPADYAIAGGALALLRPLHFIGSSMDAVAFRPEMPELSRRLGEIKTSVGILFGTADRLLDHRQQVQPLQGQIADLEVELLDGVGHMPQYAEPERVAAFIRRMADKAFQGEVGADDGDRTRTGKPEGF